MITVVAIAPTEERAQSLAGWCVCGEALNGEFRKSYDVSGRNAEIVAIPLYPASSGPFPRTDAVLISYQESEDGKEVESIIKHYTNVPVKFILHDLVEPPAELEKQWHAVKLPKNTPKELAEKLVAAHNFLARLIKGVFDQFDQDKTGYISAKDLVAAAKELNVMVRENEAQILVEQLDTDKDGRVSLGEFAGWWRGGRQGGALGLEELILGKIQGSNELMAAAANMAQFGGLEELKQEKPKLVKATIKIEVNKVKTEGGILAHMSIMSQGKSYDAYTKELESCVKLPADKVFIAVTLGCRKDPKAVAAELKEIVDIVLPLIKATVPSMAKIIDGSQTEVGLSSNNRPVLCISPTPEAAPKVFSVLNNSVLPIKDSLLGDQNLNFYVRLANSLAQMATEDRPWYESLFFDGISVEYKCSMMEMFLGSSKSVLQSGIDSVNLDILPLAVKAMLVSNAKSNLAFNNSECELEFEVDEEYKKTLKSYIGEGNPAAKSIKALRETALPKVRQMLEEVPLAAKVHNLFKDDVNSVEIFVSAMGVISLRISLVLPGLEQFLKLD